MHIFIIILMLFVEMLSLGPGCMRNSTVRDTGTRQISGPAASSCSLSSVDIHTYILLVLVFLLFSLVSMVSVITGGK